MMYGVYAYNEHGEKSLVRTHRTQRDVELWAAITPWLCDLRVTFKDLEKGVRLSIQDRFTTIKVEEFI